MGTPRWWEPEGTRAYLPVGGVCTYAHFLSRTRSAELGASTPSGEGGSLTAGAGRRSIQLSVRIEPQPVTSILSVTNASEIA